MYMKAVIAIDSFKGSLTSLQAGRAVAAGIERVFPDALSVVCPIADGGEGTVDALTEGMGGEFHFVEVTGPLGEKVTAKYGIIETQKTAVMEMSQAAGITLLQKSQLNPMKTTTYGVGEMILDAVNKGCRNFIIGIGGSATNDGGIGMLQALGFGILDKDGKYVPFGAEGVEKAQSIDDKKVPAVLKECVFNIACDVNNPLCGAEGCSAVFAPQKGADEEMVAYMDKALSRFAQIVKEKYPESDMNYPGAGAAGGLGFAFLSFLGGKLTRGIDLVIKETNLESHVKDADIVITGEGRLDSQSVHGKAPIGVSNVAKKYGKTVIAFSGCVTRDATVCNQHGIDAYFPIVRGACTLEEAMEPKAASQNLTDTVEQVFNIIKRKF